VKVLVTGATGFVGSALCEHLAQQGLAVRRALHGAPVLPVGDDVTVGDIGPRTDWREALEGVDVVVHLAARVHMKRQAAANPLAEYRGVNVHGTRQLAVAAAGAGVKRLVFLSSVKVNGERTVRPFAEADTPHPEDAYAISKWEAERAVAEVGQHTGLQWVILRPPLIYGPGVKANFRALMQAIARGVPLPLGAIDNRRSLLYLGNLVDAIRLCLVHPAAANRTFLVSDGEDLSTPDLVRRLGRALGTRPRLMSIPVGWLKLAGGILGRRDALARLTDSLQVDSALIRRELGWTPPFTVDQGLAETALWFRSQADSGLVGARGRA
jgi:nucleoside-diphosphate-sugar epimerase